MAGFLSSIMPHLIGATLIVSVLRSFWVFAKGEKINKEIKALITVLLFFGMAPSLTAAVPEIGESLVKPVVNIATYFSDTIAADLDSSVKR